MRLQFILYLLSFTSISFALQRGNGDRIDSFPNFNERQLLVLTNACRMAPVQYRDLYIGNYQVLLTDKYPPTAPVYWCLGLNKSAHAHAVDMANNCGLQHNSCNGTIWNTRIATYYNKSQYVGENIASGYTTALATVKQWVLEVDPSQSPVPADLSSSDGHRKNIMNAQYRELGTGYAKGSKQYTYFWVHDFGGGKPDFSNPLVAGCHFFIESGKITFFANYYDSSTSLVSCVIDNQTTPMVLALGTVNKGTYTLVQSKAATCRQYYFTCTKAGIAYRYPEFGSLVTFGEGNCTTDYIAPENISVVTTKTCHKQVASICVNYEKDGIHVSNLPTNWNVAEISIFNAQGKVVSHFSLTSQQSKETITLPLSNSPPSVLIVQVRFDNKPGVSSALALSTY